MGTARTNSRAPLTACIVTRDEEDRLGDCLASLSWCDEIVVIDSHSTDRTRDIAAAAGARVIERDWPGHVAQKEFAIRQASGDWVLCIDADERVSPELAVEIVELRDAGFPDRAGWEVSRVSEYLGRWIRHSGWYPCYVLRLFRRDSARVSDDAVHERVRVPGRTRPSSITS